MRTTALRNLGAEFEAVPLKIDKGRRLGLTGVLDLAAGKLESVPILTERGTLARARATRAFLVRGSGLLPEGLQEGDYLLVEGNAETSGTQVFVEEHGRFFLRSLGPGSTATGDSAGKPRRVGTLVGIIRKRGFGGGSAPRTQCAPKLKVSEGSPIPKASLLHGQLQMLESTRAGTRNPRLQRALRNEAERLRQQLRNGADINKID